MQDVLQGLYLTLVIVWSISLFTMVWGTLFTVWRVKWAPPRSSENMMPVSILKPLKGVDPGLYDNLASFAKQDYPVYEVIFSVASVDDPALAVADQVMADHPHAPFRVIVGDVQAGINPKVNNLVRPEKLAQYDIVLVSDSNIRAEPHYLRDIVPHLAEGTGCVTAIISGFGGQGLGGLLEEQHLNSFYARWMSIAHSFGAAFIIGKTMLYRRSDAAKFGGIAGLAGYVAEDFWMGKMTTRVVKKKVKLTRRPVRQYIGYISLNRFVQRHARWAVLQKKCAPWVFALEPFQFSLVAGLVGAIGWDGLFGVQSVFPFVGTILTWAFLDLWLIRELGGRSSALGWMMREVLSPCIWLDALTGSTVEWRGQKIKVKG